MKLNAVKKLKADPEAGPEAGPEGSVLYCASQFQNKIERRFY